MAQQDEDLKKRYEKLKEDYENLVESNSVLNQRLLELYTLYNVSRTLSMSLQLTELFDSAIQVIGESMRVDKYFLMLMDKESDKLVIRASHGMSEEELMMGAVAIGDGVCGEIVATGEPQVVHKVEEEDDFCLFPGVGMNAGSYLGVPIRAKDGSILGVLSALKSTADAFRDADVKLFHAVAEHVGIAIENALVFQQTRELMSRDELTNLYNRRYFFERYERESYRAERYDRSLSLLMIDIDHFKNFNDSYGHLRGDRALRKVASTLESHLRRADVVARYGGEEFLILLPETEKKSAAIVGEKLREAVADIDFKDEDGGPPARLTITVGVANMPEDGTDPLGLLDLADKALYFGKAQGRNQVCTEVPRKEPAS